MFPFLHIAKSAQGRTFIAALPYEELSGVLLLDDTRGCALVLRQAAGRRGQSLPALHVLHSPRVPAAWEPPWCKLGEVAMVPDTCSTHRCSSGPPHFSVSSRRETSLGLVHLLGVMLSCIS